MTVLPLLTGCDEAPDLETSRRFQQAEERFTAATSPEQYVQVASLYQEILDGGFRAGVVHYNQGNAWMQAGQTGRAIAAYRLAQRQLPRDVYVQANLQTALRTSGAKTREKSALDHVLFWQATVSYREKIIAATALLCGAILMTLLSQLAWSPGPTRKIAIVLATGLVVMLVSVARDWNHMEQTQHAVVVEETIGRKGGSTTYEPAFTQPLGDGTEVVVLDQQKDWLRIQVPGTGEAWIPERAAVTY